MRQGQEIGWHQAGRLCTQGVRAPYIRGMKNGRVGTKWWGYHKTHHCMCKLHCKANDSHMNSNSDMLKMSFHKLGNSLCRAHTRGSQNSHKSHLNICNLNHQVADRWDMKYRRKPSQCSSDSGWNKLHMLHFHCQNSEKYKDRMLQIGL